MGCSQVVKAAVFDTVIHWFKSNQPSHTGQTARSQKEFGFAVCLKEIVVLPFLPIGILQKRRLTSGGIIPQHLRFRVATDIKNVSVMLATFCLDFRGITNNNSRSVSCG